MNWSQARAAFAEERRGVRRPRTLVLIDRELELFGAFVAPVLPADVRESHLRAYLTARAEKVQLATAWGSIMRLVPFFRWSVARGLVLWNPAQEMECPRFSRPQRRVLNETETLALLSSPDRQTPWGARNAALLELFYGTGLRLNEAAALDLADLDLSRRQLHVRDGKGGLPRLSPLGDHLCEVLGHYLESTRPQLVSSPGEAALWLNYQGTRFHPVSLGQMVREQALKVGLNDISTHSLRHAFATHLLEGGAQLRMVQVLLGHRTLQATQLYTHLAPLELFREFRRTHPRARRRRA